MTQLTAEQAREHHVSVEDEAWLRRELAEHPEVPVETALRAIDVVHDVHAHGGCS